MTAKVNIDIADLAAEYQSAYEHGELDSYYFRRWRFPDVWAGWLSETRLPDLAPTQALTLYRAAGGRRSKIFAANPIAEVRDAIDFLLYDTITLEARFNECVAEDGAYKLAGAGPEFVSWLLCLRNPTLLAIWNRSAERALKPLGRYPPTMARGHWGLRYLDLLAALEQIRRQYGLADYPEVDQFCYFISRQWRPGKGSGPDF